MNNNEALSPEQIQAIKDGDKAAFKLLYQTYGGALLQIAKRVVVSEEAARDVLQDAIVKIWQHFPEYDPTKGRLFTWLARIVQNTALDALKKKNLKYEIQASQNIVDSFENEGVSEAHNPDTLDVQKHVNQLPQAHQTLLNLVYFGGYTHQEAAETLGIPLGTVKTRIRSAMLELKRIFDVTP
jgi:RNA polymerase sigma factor (sigma-70 family)